MASRRTAAIVVSLTMSRSEIRKRFGIEPARTIPERLCGYACLVEHGQQQVGHRRVVRIDQMSIAGEATTDERQRQVVVRVQVGIAQTRAEQEQRVIEQRAVTV